MSPFPSSYVDQIFFFWYNQDRPTAPKLQRMIPEITMEGESKKPGIDSLQLWIKNDFTQRAILLDEQFQKQFQDYLVQEKIEMLRRHADTSKQMQNMAMEYLEHHKEDLTSPAAIRLLIEGIRIEKESLGLPEALEKMSKMTDDELIAEVEHLLTDKSQLIELE